MSKYIVKFHFFEGRGIASSIIKWRTCGRFSHIAMELDGIVYEAKEGLGVVKSYSPYEHNEMGTLKLMIDIDMKSYENWQNFKMSLEDKLGCKYDWYAIFNFFGTWNKQNPDKWFCSELGDTVFPFLVKDYISDGGLVSPDLLSEKLQSYNLGVKA